MKLGPIHLLKDTTYQRPLDENERLRLELAGYQTPGFTHYAWPSRVPPPWILPPDADDDRSRRAAHRVVAAYRCASARRRTPNCGVWLDIEERQAPFLAALARGDEGTVRQNLAGMFQTTLVWGLGRVHPDHPADMTTGAGSLYLRRLLDALVALGEMVGVCRVRSLEQQGIEAVRTALEVEWSDLLTQIEQVTGLVLDFPRVGAAYGGRIERSGEPGDTAARLVTIDLLLHAAALLSARQILARGADRRAGRAAQIVEIGGGYGCLAWLAQRAGLGEYRLFDLPWVNAIQGYFLLMTCPPETIQLCGEPPAPLVVLPADDLAEVPDQSVDLVINTNSVPELSPETARENVRWIGRILRGEFLSINHEAPTSLDGRSPQQRVADLVAEVTDLSRLSRHRWWMAEGYVEEVFGR